MAPNQPRLRAPHHALIKRFAKTFSSDTRFQFKLHLIASYIWIVNMVLAISAFLFLPTFWAKFSVLYLVVVSLYANFATDYGAVSAALAASQTSFVHEKQLEDHAVIEGQLSEICPHCGNQSKVQ